MSLIHPESGVEVFTGSFAKESLAQAAYDKAVEDNNLGALLGSSKAGGPDKTVPRDTEKFTSTYRGVR